MAKLALLQLLVVAVVLAEVCANRAQDEDGAALLQMKSVQRSSSEQGGRVALIEAFCTHFQWAIQEQVIRPDLACQIIPPECRSTLMETENGLGAYCHEGENGAVPSPHDVSVFFAWTEPWCSEVADPSLLTLCVMDLEELSQTSCGEPVDIGQLVRYNSLHEGQLMAIQNTCHQVFAEGGECHHHKESLDEAVAFMQWKTREYKGDLGKYAGLVHSFLELQTVNGQQYSLEVLPLPSNDQAKTWVSWMKDGPRVGDVHAEAGANLLKPGLRVAEVIKQLKGDEKEYNLLSNNCHDIVSRTFEWAAPPAKGTPKPNPKWSLLTTSLLKAAPQQMGALANLLTRVGLGSEPHED